MPPLTQAWQVFHSLLTPLYFLFVYGRSGLRPSLVQGLRPRNAPVQNQSRRGASVCVIAPITPRQPITRRDPSITPITQIPPPRREHQLSVISELQLASLLASDLAIH